MFLVNTLGLQGFVFAINLCLELQDWLQCMLLIYLFINIVISKDVTTSVPWTNNEIDAENISNRIITLRSIIYIFYRYISNSATKCLNSKQILLTIDIDQLIKKSIPVWSSSSSSSFLFFFFNKNYTGINPVYQIEQDIKSKKHKLLDTQGAFSGPWEK